MFQLPPILILTKKFKFGIIGLAGLSETVDRLNLTINSYGDIARPIINCGMEYVRVINHRSIPRD